MHVCYLLLKKEVKKCLSTSHLAEGRRRGYGVVTIQRRKSGRLTIYFFTADQKEQEFDLADREGKNCTSDD